MRDSQRKSTIRRRRAPHRSELRRAVLGLTAAVFIAGAIVGAPTALADGDPASDVLATANLFLPWDAGLSASQQRQLAALLETALRADAGVRLAVIASPSDLGSVTQLWRRPHLYAAFLGDELSLVYRGPLVVVMPDGIGIYHAGAALSRAELSIAASPPSGSRAGALLGAAISAVRRIAAASGHVIGNVREPTAAGRPGGPGTASWIALTVGALLILAAWSASLRARPLSLRGHP